VMFERKVKPPEGPSLFDRIAKSACKRVAVLGLHASAGTRTVVASLVREMHRRGAPFALSSAPRLQLELEEDLATKPVTRMAVPEGAWIATADGTVEAGDLDVEHRESTPWETPLGNVSIFRVLRGGEIDLHGPGEAMAMQAVIERLVSLSGGTVVVDGGWERRAFAAPGVSDGIVLVLGAGYSPSPDRSAAAARYVVETLSVGPCDESARGAWEEIAKQGAAALLDTRGRPAGVLPPGLEDPVLALDPQGSQPIGTVVLPHGLNDEFMIPLVRSHFRCTLVVRDSTRINVAPVYFKAWLKGKGRIQVVRPTRILGVATNPVNASGPDAEPAEFRKMVAQALPDLPVHDVVLESGEETRKPAWRFWE
jgi:hypothetical protein